MFETTISRETDDGGIVVTRRTIFGDVALEETLLAGVDASEQNRRQEVWHVRGRFITEMQQTDEFTIELHWSPFGVEYSHKPIQRLDGGWHDGIVDELRLIGSLVVD